MGRFVNPDNSAFQVALNSEIYVDKTGLLSYTNRVLDTMQGYICNSRPRRFGKSFTANMLAAYYSKGCDSRKMFSDLAITGEGRLDGQTVMGKAPIGVARLAKEYDKPVIAFSGCVTKDASACNAAGIDAFFPVLRSVVSLEEAMDVKNAAENMADTVEQAFRLFLLH